MLGLLGAVFYVNVEVGCAHFVKMRRFFYYISATHVYRDDAWLLFAGSGRIAIALGLLDAVIDVSVAVGCAFRKDAAFSSII